jgi:uncharacterized membrane protein
MRRRWPVVLLAVSLIANGFFVGMFVADWLKPHRSFSGERFARIELRRIDDRLSQQSVDRIASELRPIVPQLDQGLQRLRDIRAELMRIASQPTPDRAALGERLAALRSEAAAMQEIVQAATYDALLRLPPEERARLAEDKGS